MPAAPPVSVREIFRRFWPYARPYRRWLWGSFIFIALVPAIDAATIGLFGVVVDRVLVPRDFGALPLIAGAYLGLTLLAGGVGFLDSYISTWVGERFVLDLRVRFFSHLQGLGLDFFERHRLGDVLSRLTGDISAIEGFVLSGVADALSYTLRLVIFVGALFYIDWRLAAVSLVVAPLFWYCARRFSRAIKVASREKRRRSGSITAVAEESLANASLVQAYNRQHDEVERYRREAEGAFVATMASTRIKELFTPVVDLIELGGGLCVLALGGLLLSRGELSLGELLVFLGFLNGLYGPIKGMTSLTNSIFAASAGAERIIEFMDQRPAVHERPDPLPLPSGPVSVEFDAVSFVYPGTERVVLEGVSLRLEPGRTVALVGPSGAGKSTVVKLLERFYDPTEGAVRMGGVDLRDAALGDLREHVALLLQETLVFEGTISENIAYGRQGATQAQVEAAARSADAHAFACAQPQGYGTLVGQRGRRLSGGQKQRVAIARAMLRDAPVLVLDEPTVGLDAGAGQRVLEPLRRLMADRATLIVSHNLLTVREADEIVVLDAGRVVERGAHDELLAAAGTYAELWRLHEATPGVAA